MNTSKCAKVAIRYVAVLIAIVALLNSPVFASTTISLDSTIDTPDRTVAYQGKNYDIQDIGSYHMGEKVNISINVTDISGFQLSLLDKNKNFMWNHMVYYTEGNAQVDMPDNVVTVPGTYAFAVFYQGDIMAVKPVVFSQYKLSVMPDATTVAPGDTLHVKVRVAPDTGIPMKVIIARNSSSLESSANRTQEGLYEADIKLPSSTNGRFSLYAALASGNMIMGSPELIGVSSGGTINVVEIPPTPQASGFSFSLVIVSLLFIGILIIIFRKIRN
ncbi:MAG: hypothetical protein O8C62_10095 [Candidatus Methanoperedens sp.]|nr:hypothetical protein [Candidatus Methanoperedens sp.]